VVYRVTQLSLAWRGRGTGGRAYTDGFHELLAAESDKQQRSTRGDMWRRRQRWLLYRDDAVYIAVQGIRLRLVRSFLFYVWFAFWFVPVLHRSVVVRLVWFVGLVCCSAVWFVNTLLRLPPPGYSQFLAFGSLRFAHFTAYITVCSVHVH